VNVLEDLGEADALLLGYVLLVSDVVAVVLTVIRSHTSAHTQTLLVPRLLRSNIQPQRRLHNRTVQA